MEMGTEELWSLKFGSKRRQPEAAAEVTNFVLVEDKCSRLPLKIKTL